MRPLPVKRPSPVRVQGAIEERSEALKKFIVKTIIFDGRTIKINRGILVKTQA